MLTPQELGRLKKGKKHKTTLEKEKVLAELRQRIMKSSNALFDAAKVAAIGAQLLYKIETTQEGNRTVKSKPILVDDPQEIMDYVDRLERGGEADTEDDPNIYYYISTKEPNIQAFKELRDTAFGKPKDSVEMTMKLPKPLLNVLYNNGDKEAS